MTASAADTSKCASCGTEGASLKSCNACKLVKYCNVACQKAHRPNHKKDCKKRAAELFDEALFKQPPPNQDCPICFLPLPHESDEVIHKSCCGKVLCFGCVHGVLAEAVTKLDIKSNVCPFCREEPPASDQEEFERLKKRMEWGDAYAFNTMGAKYEQGLNGGPTDMTKAREMWIRAGEIGCADGYFNVGNVYLRGRGVEIDMKKAKKYYELAAMAGHAHARRNIGSLAVKAGNDNRAIKHYMIGAKAGLKESLDEVKYIYMDGDVTKDDYLEALRAYQKSKDGMKSDMRDKAIKTRELIRGMGFGDYF